MKWQKRCSVGQHTGSYRQSMIQFIIERPITMDNDLYRTLIEKTNQPVSIIQLIFNEIGDPVDYITLYMNPAAETQLGLKREETIGRRAKEIRPNAEQKWFARYGEAAKTGIISAGFEMHSSTFNRYYNDEVIPLGNDKIGIIFQDITELRDKEESEKNAIEASRESKNNALNLVEKLKQSKEELMNALNLSEQNSAELNAIIEATPDGLTVYNKKGEMIFINDALKNLLESYGYGELLRDNFKQKMGKQRSTYLDSTKVSFEDTGLYRTLSEGETVKDSVFMNRLSSGEIVYSSSSSAPIINKNGEITGAVMIHKDITERVKLEKETDKLVEELRKEDRNRIAFLNMLSHELRNPLASIMASLDLMDKLIPEGQRNLKALEIAKRQGKQLTNLVDDLLDVTRITQNKIALKKETVDINELINKTVQDYQQQFIDKNIKLEVKLTTPLFLEADSSRITQVIGNLLHNAGKFTKSNDLVTVTISTDTNNNEAVITIQDTGRGIDTNDLENLFEPFTQVDKTLDRSKGGLGLGLAIVKGMVELHGGRVEGFSEGIGKGATFTIRLPLPKENVSIQEYSEKPDDKSNKSLEILIIDDNKDLAEIICELISLLGYETESAHNGTDGIAKARELQPDAIICDIGLPDISGYEVAKLIRKDAEFKDTFLIALSGYAQIEDMEKSKAAGFDRHLAKPVSLEKLQMVLDEVK